MNRKILSVLLLIPLISEAQRINLPLNGFRADDSLEKQEYSATQFDIAGQDGVWSLENVETVSKPFVTSYICTGDTLIQTERGNRNLFTLQGQQFVGSENNQTVITYDLPEMWLHFPMTCGDSIGGYFSGKGKYCDRLFLRRYGTYMTKADAKGAIVLPDGNTLGNVIRLHTVRYVCSVSAPIDTLKHDIPAFTVDSIVRNMSVDPDITREDVYRWYSEGYRYPVIEVTETSKGEDIISREVVCCLPSVQEQLAFDEGNREIRQRVDTHPEDDLKESDANLVYEVEESGGNGTIEVSYRLASPAHVRSVLADIRGFVIRKSEEFCEAGKDYRISFSTNGLRRGQYVFRIGTENEHYSEKFDIR